VNEPKPHWTSWLTSSQQPFCSRAEVPCLTRTVQVVGSEHTPTSVRRRTQRGRGPRGCLSRHADSFTHSVGGGDLTDLHVRDAGILLGGAGAVGEVRQDLRLVENELLTTRSTRVSGWLEGFPPSLSVEWTESSTVSDDGVCERATGVDSTLDALTCSSVSDLRPCLDIHLMATCSLFSLSAWRPSSISEAESVPQNPCVPRGGAWWRGSVRAPIASQTTPYCPWPSVSPRMYRRPMGEFGAACEGRGLMVLKN